MTRSEFVTLTGFEPMPEEYQEIEQAYYRFNGGKEDFCMDFVSNGGADRLYKARAATIEQLRGKVLELDRMIRQSEEEARALVAQLTTEEKLRLLEFLNAIDGARLFTEMQNERAEKFSE